MASNIIQYDLTAVGGELAHIYILLLNSLFIFVQFLADTEIYPPDKTDILLQETFPEFDFIIVGGGMSGCLIANRLVQNHNWTVLLIEAGGYPPATSEVPALYQSLIHSEYDWSFRLEPEESACQSMSCCKLSSGKVLGGTSTINNMHFTRGLPSDFDSWGCPNWNSRIVSKAFENIERFAGKSKQVQYGVAGDIPLTNLEHTESSIRVLLSKTYLKLGYAKIGKDEYLGYKDEVMIIREGKRQNGARTFLSSIKNWQNFYLLINAHVNKVLTNHPIDLRTSGVEVQLKNKEVRHIRVRKDVILTGGAINIPKLLMLSGIGPKEELEKHGINTIVDVPQVGKNLQIHISVPVFYGFPCCFDCIKNCHINLGKRVQSFAEFIMKNTGDYVKTRLNDYVTYINTKKFPHPYPNIAIYHQYYRPNENTLDKHVRKHREYDEHTRKILHLLNKDQVILEFDITLLKPKSRGNVTLRSSNPFERPVIQGNFFSDPTFQDRDTIISGINHIINMMDTEEVQDLRANLVHIDIPNCRNYKYLSDRYLNCYVRNMAFPLGDQSGTVAMGQPCDTTRPLTDTLEMRGVRGLRVAGSSVMPTIVSTRAEGTKAAVAEIASHFIKQKWIPDYPNVYQVNNKCDEEVDEDPDE